MAAPTPSASPTSPQIGGRIFYNVQRMFSSALSRSRKRFSASMNWTGGKLQRQTKWGKTQQSKQKQHFANARTKLQNGNHDPGSFVPSFMQTPSVKQRSAPSKVAGSTRSRQKVLEEYQSVAPVVNRLSPMTPRKTGNGRRQTDKRRGSTFKASVFASDKREAGVKHISSDGLDNEPGDDEDSHHMTASAVREEDEKDNAQDDLSTNDIETQRRRLLDRPDWLGLNRTNQLHLDFVSDRRRAPVAKRRKITHADKLRRQEDKHTRHRVPSIQDEYMMHGALGPSRDTYDNTSIKIKIGDAALNSQTDAMSRTKPPSSRSTTPSSEPMLLNDDTSYSCSAGPQSSVAPRGVGVQSAAAIAGSVPASSSHHSGNRKDPDQGDVETIEETFPASKIGVMPLTELDFSPISSPVAPTQKAVRGSIVSESSPPHGEINDTAIHNTGEFDKEWRRLPGIRSQHTTTSPVTASAMVDLTNLGNGKKPLPADSQPNNLNGKRAASKPKTELYATGSKDAILQKPKLGAAKDEPAKQKPVQRQQPDPDAAWRAFVFGSNEDDDESDKEPPMLKSRRAISQIPLQSPSKRKQHAEAGCQGDRQPSSSSLLTSPTGVGPPTPPLRKDPPERGAASPSAGSPASSSFPYDRPSSLANASTTGTVLNRGGKLPAKLRVRGLDSSERYARDRL